VAEQEIPRALNVQRGASILRFKSILNTEGGIPVDYSLSYFLPGYFNFHVIRRVVNRIPSSGARPDASTGPCLLNTDNTNLEVQK